MHQRKPCGFRDVSSVDRSTNLRHEGVDLMRQWELWGSAFCPPGDERARQLAMVDGLSLDWTCWAEGHVSAMQQYFDHL